MLNKVVKSSRQHFKEIEKANFEMLKEQLKAYEEKAEQLSGDAIEV